MDNIIESARLIFFSSKHWVYGHQDGANNNPNAFFGKVADCTYLSYQANLHAGYNVPFLTTTGLIQNGALTPIASQYYELVEVKDAQPGDTIYYPGHVMVLTSWNGSRGSALGAQSTKTGVVEGVGINNSGDFWKEPKFVLRPKASIYVPELDLTDGAGTGLDSPKVTALGSVNAN